MMIQFGLARRATYSVRNAVPETAVRMIASVVASIMLSAVMPVLAKATTIRFDELSPVPAHGLVFSDVRFEFFVDSAPSTDATFGGATAGCQVFVCDPSLEGDANGRLVVTFLTPAVSFAFGLVRDWPLPLSPGASIAIFDSTSNLLASQTIDLTPPPEGFAEGLFTYEDGPVGRFELTFASPALSPRFGLDNLSVNTVPEPHTVALVALGIVVLAARNLLWKSGRKSVK